MCDHVLPLRKREQRAKKLEVNRKSRWNRRDRVHLYHPSVAFAFLSLEMSSLEMSSLEMSSLEMSSLEMSCACLNGKVYNLNT